MHLLTESHAAALLVTTLNTPIKPIVNPIIIVGAARSGTKMLRDILSTGSGIPCVPYDINYIWKWPVPRLPHDELQPTLASPEALTFVSSFLQKFRTVGQETIIEKTVSNTLRIKYVRQLFPSSKLIHLIRDGRDVAISAESCWNAPMFSSKNQPPSIYLRKVAEYPFYQCRNHVFTTLAGRAKSIFNARDKSKKPVWGPVYNGIREDLDRHTTMEVCALQWSRCMTSSLNSLSSLHEDTDYISVRYEDLIADPVTELSKIGHFVESDQISDLTKYGLSRVQPRIKRGNPTERSIEEKREFLSDFLRPTLMRTNYL